MMEIDVYYLMDYENVGSDGLMGCNSLKKTDHIVIFFTEHAKKIDMSDIANHGSAEIEMQESNPQTFISVPIWGILSELMPERKYVLW